MYEGVKVGAIGVEGMVGIEGVGVGVGEVAGVAGLPDSKGIKLNRIITATIVAISAALGTVGSKTCKQE